MAIVSKKIIYLYVIAVIKVVYAIKNEAFYGMKKFLLIALVCFTAIFCTGCIRLGYNIDINKKDEITLSSTKGAVFVGFKSDIFNNALKSELENTIQKYKKEGYDVQTTVNGDYGALILKKEGVTFGEAAKLLPDGFEDGGVFEANRGLIKRKYKIHLIYNMEKAINRALLEYNNFRLDSKVLGAVKDNIEVPIVSISTMQLYGSDDILVTKKYADGNSAATVLNKAEYEDIKNNFLYPESVLTIKIPVKASKNNADNVISDTEYQWYLAKAEQPVEIMLEYEYNDYSKLAAIISLGVLLGAVLLLVQKLQKSDVVKGL